MKRLPDTVPPTFTAAPDRVELWRRVLDAARRHTWPDWCGTEAEWCDRVVRSLEQSPRRALCKCGEPAEASHPCPYSVDVHYDPELRCDCCDACTDECARDI